MVHCLVHQSKALKEWRKLCPIEKLDWFVVSYDLNSSRKYLGASQRCGSTWTNTP